MFDPHSRGVGLGGRVGWGESGVGRVSFIHPVCMKLLGHGSGWTSVRKTSEGSYPHFLGWMAHPESFAACKLR